MRKLLLFLSLGFLAVSCMKYDDTALKNSLQSLEGRVATLEEQVKTANGNVSSLTTLVESLQGNVYVTSVNNTNDGCTIAFSNGTNVNITNGTDGTDGADGTSLTIKKDENGFYCWVADGKWLLGENGERLPVCGTDGEDGADGVTPQFKIEEGYWFLSVDKGVTWTKQGKATGDKGEAGDSMFKSVTFDDSYVYIVLAGGEELKLSRGANGVQSITVIPEFADGSIDASNRSFCLRVDVVPKSAAESVGKLDLSCFSIKGVYTQTKASAGDFFSLPVESVEVKDGVLYIHVSSSFASEFHTHKVSANASLIIDDGNTAVTSGYFHLYNGPYGINGHEYVEMGDGLKWATCNLGANSPEDPGFYYAWAEVLPKTTYTHENYKWGDSMHTLTRYTDGVVYNSVPFTGIVDNKTSLSDYNFVDDAARANWGSTWRLPTDDELDAFSDESKFTITYDSKNKGFLVTSKISGYEGNSLFFPVTGNMSGSTLRNTDEGMYWCDGAGHDYIARCREFISFGSGTILLSSDG